MEELYKILGLDEGAPVKKMVAEVKKLQAEVESKTNIIGGLQKRLDERDERIDNILDGAMDIRVQNLVTEVMEDTEHHVGGDKVELLQNKARKFLLADTDEEKASIKADMEAICKAWGERISNKSLENLFNGRGSTPSTKEGKREKRAQELVEDNGMTWKEAYAKVIEEEELAEKNAEVE